ncbi:MAG: MarR family winged helix-turn-helix transcriptional regulator [Ilumatobacteraceae bacterium]
MGNRDVRSVGRMRAFNRFYTEIIGALADRHEGLALTLAESRCLFTIDRLGQPDIGQIAEALRLDLGYVSRLVSRLERAGRVRRERSKADGRRRVVTLTPAGASLFAEVARRSDARMTALTSHLSRTEIDKMLMAMDSIRNAFQREDTR